MAQARILTAKNIEKTYSNSDFDKFDKAIGIKEEDVHTEEDLANARFKASYQMIYSIVGLGFFVSVAFLYFSEEINYFFIGTLIEAIVFGLFTFIFHQNKDTLMLGFLALFIALDKVFLIVLTQRIGGLSIVVIGLLFLAMLTAFKANRGMHVNLKTNKF